MDKRILLVSSTRDKGFEVLPDDEQFHRQPYSVYAILHYLKLMGWQTRRTGWKTSLNIVALAKLIDNFKPTIIYTYGSTLALNPLFCRRFLCKWKQFKVVHGWDDVYGDIWHEIAWWPGRILMNVMEKIIVTRSDYVVTLSYYLKNRGEKWGVACHYIPNGANIPEFDQAQCTIKLAGDFNLVYTGDQARWKRTADVCRAMRSLPDNIKLYLTGRIYNYLQKYASKNCIFLGYVSKNDQLCVMDQADVLVVTANQDCNAKLQEYLRFKKPILGYDDIPNLFFKKGHNAMLTKDYATAIMELYHNPALRETLVKNAEQEIPVYNWEEIAQQFDAYFTAIS